LPILLGLFEALELLITQLVKRSGDLSVYLSNSSEDFLVLLVATDSLGEPIRHDPADVGEFGTAFLAPGQIPGSVQMATGAFATGVTTASPHLIEAGSDHRRWAQYLLQQHAALLIQAVDLLSEFAYIQERTP
jgi:hypothetical protein